MSRSYLVITHNANLSFPASPSQRIFTPNEQGSIGIQQARELIQWAHLKPYQGKRKVAIIHHADKLTVEAQNCLLKTLEELPSNTTLILVTQRKESLLPTVISRCQVLTWERAQQKKINNLLLEGEMSENPEHETISKALTSQFIQTITGSDLPSAFSQIEKLTQRHTRAELMELMNQAILLLHQKMDSEKNLQFLEIIAHIETAQKYLRQQANIKLALENLFLALNSQQQ